MTDELCDLVEIRLLGPLRVRRGDGSWVDPSEWRTRKTVELLRILALQSGRSVPVDELLERLWPGSDSERGKTSLRTAASHIRKVLHDDCVAREHGGLALRNVWVDSQTFMALAQEVRQAAADGRFAAAVATAHQADTLYVRDLDVSDDGGDWSVVDRDALRLAQAEMLVDAACSAVSLQWMRDAAQFAERALAVDPYSERACRAAMLAFRGVGEIQRALNVYSECKFRLADELGVDPSPQTQAVHLQVLRTDPPIDLSPDFVGLESETADLAARLNAMAGRGEGGCVVLAGPPRAGTTRWLAETSARLDVPMQELAPQESDTTPIEQLPPGIFGIDGVESWPPGRLRATIEAQHRGAGPSETILIATHRTGVDQSADDELDALQAEGLVQRVDLPQLASSEVAHLAQLLTSGQPAPDLLDRLSSVSHNHAGLVVDVLATWLSTARLVYTPRGLELSSDAAQGGEASCGREQLALLFDRLSVAELAVLEAVTAATSGLTVNDLVIVLGIPTHPDGSALVAEDTAKVEVATVVSRLEELAVLAVDSGGRYVLRAPLLRDAVRTWMRPGARRRLHRRYAEKLALPVVARVSHWVEAGESALACAAAMGGAVEAMTECNFSEARWLLLQVRLLMDTDTASPEDRLDVLYRLAVCSEHLGSKQEAAERTLEARSFAADSGLAWPLDATPTESVSVPGIVTHRERRGLIDRLGITTSTSPNPEVEALLRDALALAEGRHHENDAIEARLLLAGLVLVPRRSFAEARRVLMDAAKLRTSAYRSMEQLTRHEADVLLGDPAIDLVALDLAWQGAVDTGLSSGLSAGILTALAHHDRADSNAAKILDEAIADAEERQLRGPWRWVVARMLVQRGQTSRAQSIVSTSSSWRVGSPTAQVLALLGKAELAVALGNKADAAASLMRGVEIAQRTGATLMLPEVAARLVIVGDEDDHESALEYLDLAEVAIGESTTGRERVILMMARASVRAIVGRLLSAAAVAGGAAALATSLGLEYSAAEATARRAAYLEAAGASADDRRPRSHPATQRIPPRESPDAGATQSLSQHPAHDV